MNRKQTKIRFHDAALFFFFCGFLPVWLAIFPYFPICFTFCYAFLFSCSRYLALVRLQFFHFFTDRRCISQLENGNWGICTCVCAISIIFRCTNCNGRADFFIRREKWKLVEIELRAHTHTHTFSLSLPLPLSRSDTLGWIKRKRTSMERKLEKLSENSGSLRKYRYNIVMLVWNAKRTENGTQKSEKWFSHKSGKPIPTRCFILHYLSARNWQ